MSKRILVDIIGNNGCRSERVSVDIIGNDGLGSEVSKNEAI